jgi:UDP-glucose 4-epimerase
MRVVVLRLPLLYGADVGGNLARLLKLVRRGIPILATDANRRSMLGVSNAADALVTALYSSSLPSGAYFVADDAPFSSAALVGAIGAALGRRPRIVRIPARAAVALRAALQFLARLPGMAALQSRADRLLGSLEVDDSPFRSATGWRPPEPPDADLNRMARAGA